MESITTVTTVVTYGEKRSHQVVAVGIEAPGGKDEIIRLPVSPILEPTHIFAKLFCKDGDFKPGIPTCMTPKMW